MNLILQHFSKRTLLLVAGLLVVTAGLLYLALQQDQPHTSISQVPTPTPNPAHAVLSFVPETSTPSASYVVDVVATSNENKISGAQLDIAYDPHILKNVTIKPGNYFPNPTILFNSMDKINGKISYVLAIQPTGTQATGNGVVATISYSLAPTASTSTMLTFLPKTEVTQWGIIGSVLKTVHNLTIQIPAAFRVSPTPTL